jgi:hypothetical protein
MVSLNYLEMALPSTLIQTPKQLAHALLELKATVIAAASASWAFLSYDI